MTLVIKLQAISGLEIKQLQSFARNKIILAEAAQQIP